MNTYKPTFKTVTLDKRILASSVYVDDLIAGRLQWNEYRDEVKRGLICELKYFVFGKDHPQRHIIRYPANWLEAVKEHFAPCWLRDKWPVKFTTITASLEEIYPDIEPSLPNKRHVLKFAVMNQPEYPTW